MSTEITQNMSTNIDMNKPGPKVVVMGAGAVGSYFGAILSRAGTAVTLVARHSHAEAISRNGLLIDSINFKESINIAATTDVAAVKDADVVLLCVKTMDTKSAAKMISSHLKPEAIVLSLQNGVDNVDIIRAAAGINAFAAVVYVAVQFTGPGQLKHNGRGDLLIGSIEEAETNKTDLLEKLKMLANLFTRANVPCRISDNIRGELWAKMITNCAYNPISALTRSNYSSMLSNPLIKELITAVVEESIKIAEADQVRLPDFDILDSVLKLAESMGGAVSSTAQDLARGKLTEIDALNGYVLRRGKARGIPTPVNTTLYSLVKQLERAVITESSA